MADNYFVIKDCFRDIRNGANIRQAKGLGGLPITRIETISGNTFNRDRLGYADVFDANQYAKYVLQDNDILMSHINSMPYLGRAVKYCKKPEETIIHGMNLLLLRPMIEIVDPEYAVYYFASNGFKAQIARIAKKSVNQASFSIADLKRIPFPNKPLSLQREIAFRLSSIDKIKGICKTTIDLLDSCVKSRFAELDKEVNFDRIPLGAILDKQIISAKKKYADEDEIQYIDISSIDNMNYEITNPCVLEMREAPSRARQCLRQGDVLVSMVRPNLHNIAINRSMQDNLVASTGFCILRSEIYSSEFLRAIATSDAFCTSMCQVATGASYPAVKSSDIYNYLFPAISVEEDKAFSKFANQVDKSKFVVKQMIERLETLKASLMQEYFE